MIGYSAAPGRTRSGSIPRSTRRPTSTIFDFSAVDDTILLSHTVFTAAGATGSLAAAAFVETPVGTETASSRVIYNSTTGAVSYDADGTGGGSTAIQFAILSTGLALGNANFKIV